MSWRLPLVLAVGVVPASAEACASCVSTAVGDQTYNWAYIGLMGMPFAILAVIGVVLAYHYGRWGPGLFRRAPRDARGSGPLAAAPLAQPFAHDKEMT